MTRARCVSLGVRLVVGAIALLVPLRRPTEPNIDHVQLTTLADLERELDALRVRLGIPGMSAALGEQGRVTWTREFGWADIEHQRRVERDTIFHLASVHEAVRPRRSRSNDVVRFSMALDEGKLLRTATLERAYSPVNTPRGETLPYGLGWFVQQRDGLTLVWHFGQSTESSSLIVKIPRRQITFVLLANSDGLSRHLRLGDRGDVTASPAANLFLKWCAGRKQS